MESTPTGSGILESNAPTGTDKKMVMVVVDLIHKINGESFLDCVFLECSKTY